jgi:putative ABC transport system permease protein
MFDSDFWQEVLETIRKQKWRSLMTAFGVFWGLFMLMFLIGAGMGFSGGTAAQMKQMPSNAVGYIPSTTTIAFGGLDRGRNWLITDDDFNAIEQQFPGAIRDKILILEVPSRGQQQRVKADAYTDMMPIAGVSESYDHLSPIKILEGRFFDKFDIRESRKVCMLGEQEANKLFPGQSAVGKEVHVGGIICHVIGTMRKMSPLINIGPDESGSLYLPITTAQFLYNKIGQQDKAYIVLNDEFPSGAYYKKIGTLLRQRHSISPNDDSALQEMDLKQVLNQFEIMTGGINSLVWLVGLGTLLAGLIGIANIMMVTVKERTQEIGVRRALGAQPGVIIRQIMCESLVLTLAAGIVGIVAGFWGLYTVNLLISTEEGGMFVNPHVPFWAALSALIILVLGGLFAGWLPAKRAMAIKAIEALREE